ncbi:surface-adhesin E family protein [Burkholderia ubonensis]|uniref:surface-adhesin E family protein n=1 Tax=Burkholderia ubonensis TaxID=101571 RepID=UPI0012FC4C8C|nr:surface-adhesin E family protein [Burkholderia ubonensis]
MRTSVMHTLFALIALSASTSALAQQMAPIDWRLIGGSEDENLVLVDANNQRKGPDGTIDIWMRTIWRNPEVSSEGTFQDLVQMARIDCIKSEFSIQATTIRTRDGRVISTVTGNGLKKRVPSGSIGESLVNVVCRDALHDNAPFSDVAAATYMSPSNKRGIGQAKQKTMKQDVQK